MPDQTACPNCQKIGLVRSEHVIKGGLASRFFYCGACEHQWSTADLQPATMPPPPPKARSRSFGPKRRS